MTEDTPPNAAESLESQTVLLRVIATLLLIGGAYAAAELLVTFMTALILAIALSPVSSWLERRGLSRTVASLACTLAVASALLSAAGLFAYEAGTIVQDSDKYLKQFGGMIDGLQDRIHHRQPAHRAGPGDAAGRAIAWEKGREASASASASATAAGPQRGGSSATPGRGEALLRRGIDALSRWLVTGVGGLLGVLGGAVVFLAFLLYMLQGRDRWLAALTAASRRLGLKPAPGQNEKVQNQIVRYVGCLSIVSVSYMFIVSGVLWAIGVPQPILWGVLAGMLEVIPYFGPLVASVLPTVVALSLGSWWQPAATLSIFLTLHLIEGNVIAPIFYGKAVRLDPVTILFGAIFFGGLWGPIGLAIATPMMIILRGLLLITPDTPALDALAGVKTEKAEATREADALRPAGR